MRRLIHLLTILLLLGLSSRLSGQAFFNDRYAGFSLGASAIADVLPEGYAYTPLSMLLDVAIWQHGPWRIYGEAQFTSAVTSELEGEYEFGANFGFQYWLRLRPNLALAAGIGSGPHYITVETRRQANGFIFSDNFDLGLFWRISGLGAQVSIRTRFRHISNAGLQSPNGGIDNLFVVFGLAQAVGGGNGRG